MRSQGQKWKVLDIAAGHGMYGVTIAKQNPNAEIFAVDWPQVLQVAEENANAAGVAARYHKIPGSAFEVDFGNDYDLVLLTGFLHHFDQRSYRYTAAQSSCSAQTRWPRRLRRICSQ